MSSGGPLIRESHALKLQSPRRAIIGEQPEIVLPFAGGRIQPQRGGYLLYFLRRRLQLEKISQVRQTIQLGADPVGSGKMLPVFFVNTLFGEPQPLENMAQGLEIGNFELALPLGLEPPVKRGLLVRLLESESDRVVPAQTQQAAVGGQRALRRVQH